MLLGLREPGEDLGLITIGSSCLEAFQEVELVMTELASLAEGLLSIANCSLVSTTLSLSQNSHFPKSMSEQAVVSMRSIMWISRTNIVTAYKQSSIVGSLSYTVRPEGSTICWDTTRCLMTPLVQVV